jgi:hypothetical protein
VTHRLKLDHLVYAVPSLVHAIDQVERCLGLAPAFGGQHQGLGTHNAILPLADEIYLELIAKDPDQPAPKQARPFGLDELQEPRLVTWAIRSRTIETDVARSRERGFDPGFVFAMNREEPGGAVLRWKLTLSRQMIGDGLVPFVIDWGSTPHPAGRTEIEMPRCALSRFSAFHPDPSSIRVALDALGAELDVEVAAEASLEARLTGPVGHLDLR